MASVIGTGLTVAASAPNPAGQSILKRAFPDGIYPAAGAVGYYLASLCG